MGTEEKKVLDSHILYPTMMQSSKLLVLDYDVTRYHSFDLFRHLLMDKNWFIECDPMYIPFVKEPDVLKQILFYMRHCLYMNPVDNFPKWRDKVSPAGVEDILNEQFSKLYTTPTEVNEKFEVVFQRPDITAYLLKYKNDPHTPGFSAAVKKTYTSDHLLNLNMAMAIIEQHQINAVMTSSVDIALALALRIVKQNLPTPVTFLIGTYFYNYDEQNRLLRNIPLMNKLEYLYKFEFSIFDPFTGLNQQRKEGIIIEPTE